MDVLKTVIATVLMFSSLILVHELGHFLTARAVGIRVKELAVGLGPKILSFNGKETLYSLRPIPLGGFNKIYGLANPAENGPGAFQNAPLRSKVAVIAAGSIFNLIFAVMLTSAALLWDGNLIVSEAPVIGATDQGSPAAESGLLAGDRIVAINGVRIDQWAEVIPAINLRSDRVSVVTDRGGATHTAEITPVVEAGAVKIGIRPIITSEQVGLVDAVMRSVNDTYKAAAAATLYLGRLFTGDEPVQLNGPVAIGRMTGQALQTGYVSLFLHLTAMFSILLGVTNLLPLPGLDGSHIIVNTVETIVGRTFNPTAVKYFHVFGFGCMMALMLFVTCTDILSWLQS